MHTRVTATMFFYEMTRQLPMWPPFELMKRRGLFPGKWQTNVLFLGLKTISVALQTKHIDSTWAYIYRLRIIVMLSRKVGWVCWIVHYAHGNKIDGLKLLKEINGLYFFPSEKLWSSGGKREREREKSKLETKSFLRRTLYFQKAI